jgi:hypothetical protein
LTLISKILTLIFIVFSITCSFCTGLEENYNPVSNSWNFQNSNAFSFGQTINFTDTPHLGVPDDSRLVGYWNLNEGSGVVAQDSSRNGNNASVNGARWIVGKFENSLSFTGNTVDFVKANNSESLQIKGDLTLSCWVYFNTLTTKQTLIFKNYSGEFELSMDGANGKLEFDHNKMSVFSPPSSVKAGVWLYIVAVRSITAMTITFYVNGIQVGTPQAFTTLPTASSNPLYIGQENGYNSLNGIIDDIRIYNRSLSANEVSSLYDQSDPLSFANYYYFVDPLTNNSMVVNVNSLNTTNSSIAFVTCSSFFENNILAFSSNNTATVNVWTNLGQPTFTTGVWNSQNCTTTLTLEVSSTGALNWSPSTPPSSLSILTNATNAGGKTTFSVLWSDKQTMFGSGYIFCSNNTGQWVNASWLTFKSDSFWGNATLTLNSTVGSIIGFREYANNSLNLWGDSGVYAITTTANTVLVTPSPAPSVEPTATPTTMISPVPTSTPRSTPTVTPTLMAEDNQFPTQPVQIIALTISLMIGVFTLAFRKGYMRIEVANEEDSEEETEEFLI